MRSSRRHQQSTDTVAVVTPLFKLVFFSVLAFTVAAFATDGLTALLLHKPDTQAQDFLTLCTNVTTGGFGAIVGLLAGKLA